MSADIRYPHGAPCWVDSWQPDPAAARRFYARLFGWQLDPVPAGQGAPYLNASVGGRLVAGIGQAPAGTPAIWALNIRIDEIESAIETITAAGGRQLVDTIEIGEQGRIAVVCDATAVAFAIWEAGTRHGAQLRAVPNSWAMSALHTTDLGAAEHFYGSVFGWEFVRDAGSGLIDCRLRGERIAVATPTDGRAVPPHWATNFLVADVDAFAEQARVLGGTVRVAPMDTPGFRSAALADPQGGVFAVSAPQA